MLEIQKLCLEMLAPIRAVRPPPQTVTAWMRPPAETIKLNCDASWSRETNRGGIGVIARDSSGVVRGGLAETRMGGSAEELEAEAVLGAVRLAIDNR